MRQRIKINRIQNFVNQFWDLFYLNLLLYDMLFKTDNVEFTSYAHGITPFLVGKDIDVIKSILQHALENILQWSSQSQTEANLGKRQFICSCKMIIM